MRCFHGLCDRARYSPKLAKEAARSHDQSCFPRQNSVGRETFHSCRPAIGVNAMACGGSRWTVLWRAQERC